MSRTFHFLFQVFDNCDNIPHYTPIATFDGEKYHAAGAQSGVLVKCIDNGFMVRLFTLISFNQKNKRYVNDLVIFHTQ